MNTRRQQSGVILVFLVIIIAVLLGIAAFSLDLGRLLVLKTEMQNAVDEAALAGAKELDAATGSVKRAKAAALGLITAKAHFNRDITNDKDLLSPDLGENDVQFRFFCAIENDMDVTGNSMVDCGSYLPENGKVEVPEEGDGADTYVHYIEVTLNPKRLTEEVPRYSIPLFFLPALRVLGLTEQVQTEASTTTRALAGRQYMPCEYPPLMMCNPAEVAPNTFDSSLELQTGDMVVIRTQGGPNSGWAPGNFGFLLPAVCVGPDGKNTCGGATKDELEKQLANESEMGCNPPYVSTYTGQKMSSSIEPMNTRFGINSTSTNTAAPNIVDYPRDDSISSGAAKTCSKSADPDECRFGDGVWDQSGDDPDYPTFTLYPHAISETDYLENYFVTSPGGTSQPKRYNHYLSEIQNNTLPGLVPNSPLDNALTAYNASVPKSQQIADCAANAKVNDLANCINLYGNPSTKTSYVGEAKRRVLYVASLNCLTQGIKGNTPNIYVPPPPAGWKKFFLTEHVGKMGTDGAVYYAEYLGPAMESDGNFDVVIQLYE